MKPFLTNKGAGKSKITPIDNDNIISEDSEVAQTMGDFFSKAVTSLNICIIFVDVDDPIDNIIAKFSQHPSIKLINKTLKKGNLIFEL